MVPLPAAADPAPLLLPLLGRRVPAGFPSPADDYLEGGVDLNRYLIERPAACYLMRVSGASMSGAGIMDGDLVVVDRSVEAVPGHVVVAVLGGEMTIKRLRRTRDGRAVLRAEHPDYPAVVVGEGNPAEVWGVVVGCVRQDGLGPWARPSRSPWSPATTST
jgi:DNA polymerase V